MINVLTSGGDIDKNSQLGSVPVLIENMVSRRTRRTSLGEIWARRDVRHFRDLTKASSGHDVPREKIKERYPQSLDNLLDAIAVLDHACMFDNSGVDQIWFAEITDGNVVEIIGAAIPRRFEKYVLQKGHAEAIVD